MSFESALEFGKTGASAIAGYFKQKGYHVLPVYEKLDKEYKGPAVYMADGTNLIAPDMLVFGKQTYWVEAKHKSAFCWHRISQQWTTGIDAHHYAQYLEISKNSQWPVWLLFLQGKGVAKDTPAGMKSPTGLFGNEISLLDKTIDHSHKNWGKHGMVYWSRASLKLLANIEDFIS